MQDWLPHMEYLGISNPRKVRYPSKHSQFLESLNSLVEQSYSNVCFKEALDNVVKTCSNLCQEAQMRVITYKVVFFTH